MKKKILSFMVVIFMIGFLAVGCDSKSPEIPGPEIPGPEIPVYALNEIEVYAVMDEDSSVGRLELKGVTTYEGENKISDIKLCWASLPFGGVTMIESHKFNNETVTTVLAADEHPIKLEVGRDEYNKFEKGKSEELNIQTSCWYSSSHILDYDNESYSNGANFSYSGSSEYVINIDTEQGNYTKTVTLYSNATYGFTIMANLKFVKI